MKKQDIKRLIHPLGEGKSGKIRFVCYTDKKEHTIISTINRLTGDRMTGCDHSPPSIGHSVKEVQTIFNNIRKKSLKVIEVVGDF